MKFILHMLQFYAGLIFLVTVLFWPFMAFDSREALPMFLIWILFLFFTGFGISLYFEEREE